MNQQNPTVTYKTFSPMGDLIAALPGMRQVYRETGKKAVIAHRLFVKGHYYEGAVHSTFDPEGNAVCINREQFNMLKPLLESQDYIERYEEWNGQEFAVNLDVIREQSCTPMPHGSLIWWNALAIPQMAADYSEAWLDVYAGGYYETSGKVIINRTERYTNQLVTYFFLKKYEDKLIFSGTDTEYKRFCNDWNLNIPKLHVLDFLQLAKAIKTCKFFVGNQSANFWIAEALKQKRMLEVCPAVANTFPNGKNGYPFMQQVNLEYFFEKLITL